MSGIEIRGLAKTYGENAKALNGLDLDVRAGELVVLVGPSGSGKTTLLRLVAGLDQPTAGTIRLDGRDLGAIAPRQRDVALVFQSLALYEHWTVRQNLAFAARRNQEQGEEAIAEAARVLRIEHLLDRRPAELSGGEQQRVALGRAIVRQPKALLLDEPLSSLDLPTRRALRQGVRQVQRNLGVPTIYVTHDQAEALALGDRVAVLNEGRLAQIGTPDEIYHQPKNRFVAEFFGPQGMNLIAGEITSGRLQLHETDMLLGIRPEDIDLIPLGSTEPATTHGQIETIEDLGESKYLHVRLNDNNGSSQHPLIAVRIQDHLYQPEPKTELQLYFRTDRIHAFDRQTGIRIADA
jgi:ABC-type sugar transport system ATPase subunit